MSEYWDAYLTVAKADALLDEIDRRREDHQQRVSARIAALDAVSRAYGGQGANPELMITQADALAEWILAEADE